MKELADEAINPISTKKDLNQKIAEYNGISVKNLLNSPNYSCLMWWLHKIQTKRIYGQNDRKLDISEKEAWALVAVAAGLLEIWYNFLN